MRGARRTRTPVAPGHHPFVEDRATVFETLAVVWPPFETLGVREGRDLVTDVLSFWLTDRSERTLRTFVKRWALAEAQRQHLRIEVTGAAIGPVEVVDWEPRANTDGVPTPLPGHVMVCPAGAVAPRALIPVSRLQICATP